MLCAYPLTLVNGQQVPCRRCMPCRINNRRAKTARLLLEAKAHVWSTFITLTYDEDQVPVVNGEDGAPVRSLRRGDVQLLWKRLRHHTSFRYFVVGEYGDKTGRPHYHAAVFGPDPVELAHHARASYGWPHGHVDVRLLEVHSAAYISGYTIKKMTRRGDGRLDGAQEPEFMRQSVRPVIGTSRTVLEWLVKLHHTAGGAALLATTRDVARNVKIGGKQFPLDRTMRKWLRSELGVPEEDPERPPPDFKATLEDQESARKVDEKMWLRYKRGVF